MCRRMPERLPLTNKAATGSVLQKGPRADRFSLKRNRSRAVCIETDVNCCKETDHLFRWRQEQVAKIVHRGEH